MTAAPRPVSASLEEYGRGVVGGLIFSLPLLYTMEVWWAGFSTSPERLLAGLLGTFFLLLAYNAAVGLREDYIWVDVARESIEELGIGLLVAFAALALLARIDTTMPPLEVVGKVILEGMIVAIGVSVGTSQLGLRPEGGDGGADEDAQRGSMQDRTARHGVGNIVVLSLCGAVLVAANVAPTEEIVILGSELSPVRLLLTVAASLLLAVTTLFFSEFAGSHHLRANRAPRLVALGCVIAYAVALGSSAAILWFFGRFDAAPVHLMVAETVVLALPATLGASAGRLLLQ